MATGDARCARTQGHTDAGHSAHDTPFRNTHDPATFPFLPQRSPRAAFLASTLVPSFSSGHLRSLSSLCPTPFPLLTPFVSSSSLFRTRFLSISFPLVCHFHSPVFPLVCRRELIPRGTRPSRRLAVSGSLFSHSFRCPRKTFEIRNHSSG